MYRVVRSALALLFLVGAASTAESADFDAWPHFSRAMLFMLMFVGGCAGSTGGSVKVARLMIVLKKMKSDLRRLLRPQRKKAPSTG